MFPTRGGGSSVQDNTASNPRQKQTRSKNTVHVKVLLRRYQKHAKRRSFGNNEPFELHWPCVAKEVCLLIISTRNRGSTPPLPSLSHDVHDRGNAGLLGRERCSQRRIPRSHLQQKNTQTHNKTDKQTHKGNSNVSHHVVEAPGRSDAMIVDNFAISHTIPLADGALTEILSL